MTQTFNLIDEPWIEVLDTSGGVRTVSIAKAFTDADRIRRIAGDLPTQDAAILRLLLAILHRALPVSGDDERVMRTWAGWWRDGALPLGHVRDYLGDVHDRFDLLDAEHPFFQVAGLHTLSGNMSGVSKLVADLPAGHQFFTTRAGADTERLALPEAARWLVHCQAFDSSGIKSGAVGDERVKGGKGYPIGTGWSGNLGVLVLEGETLAHTLLLNLVLTHDSGDEDEPPWEADGWTAAATGQDSPRGPAQAMTWQTRRIRLGITDGEVTEALISNGDQVRVRNQHQVETMTAWRRSEAQEKKHGEALAYMPREHRAERLVWRGLDSLIAADPVPVGVSRQAKGLESANLSWLGALRHHGHVEPGEQVAVHTVGLVYGTQSASIVSLISDRLTLRAEVLDSPDLQDCAVRASRAAEQVAYLVGRLAANLAAAEGRDGDPSRDRAAELAYQRLDPLFREWLADLSTESRAAQEAAWTATARATALSLGQQLYAAAGPAAIRGRVTTDRNSRSVRIDAGWAHRLFARQVWAELPETTDDSPTEPEVKETRA